MQPGPSGQSKFEINLKMQFVPSFYYDIPMLTVPKYLNG